MSLHTKIGLFSALLFVLGACQGAQPSGEAPAAKDAGVEQDATRPVAAAELNTIVLPRGQVGVRALMHGSFSLSVGDKLIYVDPTMDALKAASGGDDVTGLPKADLILLTDLHGDHMDADAVAALRKEGAAVIAPKAVIEALGEKLPAPTLMENGQQQQALDGALTLEATPMYNLVRKREDTGEFFHVKGRGNGYLLSVFGGKIYISGDTECTPEMKALEGIDAAFVTMNLPYTMPVEEAAECIRAFKPKAIYPFHYRGQEPAALKALLSDVPQVQLRLLEWYPAAKAQ